MSTMAPIYGFLYYSFLLPVSSQFYTKLNISLSNLLLYLPTNLRNLQNTHREKERKKEGRKERNQNKESTKTISSRRIR